MVAGLRAVFAGQDTSRLLVGLEDPDDAAVYDLAADGADGQALIFTADYFPPVVDGAYDYGAIAASNALSDVYAMGGRPLLALNLAGFPDDMPEAVAGEILRGGAETVRAAEALLGGGHTTRSDEPIYGLAVVGMVPREAVIRKGGARPGEVLALTKPLGVGVVTTAGKRGQARSEDLRAAIGSMRQLNAVPAAAARRAGVRCGTDVTGFGLLGHLWEMASASEVGFRVRAADVPLLPGALEYAAQGAFPGGAYTNEAFFAEHVAAAPGVEPLLRRLLFAPETAGGLLLAVPATTVAQFVADCRAAGQEVALIGDAVVGQHIRLM